MLIRRLAVVVAAVLVLATAGGDHAMVRTSPGAGPAAGDHGPAALALIRPRDGFVSELMLADLRGRTWTVARPLEWITYMTWSPDGSRLAWLEVLKTAPLRVRLHVLNVNTGALHTISPCSCRGLGFLGDNIATLSGDGAALVLYPPSGEPIRTPLDPPQPRGSSIVTDGRDRVVVVSPLDERVTGFRGQSTLGVVDRAGHVTPLVAGNPTTNYAWGKAGDDRFIWIDSPRGGVCASGESLRSAMFATGLTSHPMVPTDDAFRTNIPADQRRIRSLSVVADGVIATFMPSLGCREEVRSAQLLSYHWHDGTWTSLGARFLSLDFVRGDRAIALEAYDPVDPHGADRENTPLGQLQLTTADRRLEPIAEDVEYVIVNPIEREGARVRPIS
jgi:hypothetical protein